MEGDIVKKIAYCIVWILVSLVSSFNCIVEWDWGFLLEQPWDMAEYMKQTIFPLSIWTIAFFIDYLYNVLCFNAETQTEIKLWRILAVSSVIALFIAIGLSIFYFNCLLARCIIFGIFIIVFVVLKLGSLFGIKESQEIRQIQVKLV